MCRTEFELLRSCELLAGCVQNVKCKLIKEVMERSVSGNLEESVKMSWSVRDGFMKCVGPRLDVLVRIGQLTEKIPGVGHWARQVTSQNARGLWKPVCPRGLWKPVCPEVL